MADEPSAVAARQTSANWIDAPRHRVISGDELMAGESVIIIRHGTQEHRLRVTAAGKLILTQ